MKDYPREQINRAVIILRYKQPYIDWVRTAGLEPMELTLEEANEETEVFLVSSYDSSVEPIETAEDAVKWAEKRWRMLFEHILEGWIVLESEWPQNRTLNMFREWFEVEYHSIVWDMGYEPLMFEEWIDDEEGNDEDGSSDFGPKVH